MPSVELRTTAIWLTMIWLPFIEAPIPYETPEKTITRMGATIQASSRRSSRRRTR